ncbi:MAG: hypothetical protein VE98_C0001G0589 [candidate division Kazan bacterium GW2011_GWA1_50_15]|uniref:Uncharacterized protein n=2 Tax=Bacteria division Kazan-3B-28 TaxID=1798534 RepID=A0A0G1X8Y3_UNCK3|nr:MAG: hypothetical protein VE98_C0001G0589 [candidate division Kazan bacterium GW2011_GWA1_50_15]KKW25725.1 MAG: hypothetical protein VE99_C0001G0364 [candidate division Kazan bacterium GW2011_GWC1_52_13]KKW27260.1 MAG: hypothetical protein VF00_C0001G0195 [candidate division Kazan bacterium GW2011_GWB1_52_7]HAV65986.1 hypothetical protein [Patescibacteria group bacterium]HCR42554.1 hypothetical protein [Patescibacteria group bacterium]
MNKHSRKTTLKHTARRWAGVADWLRQRGKWLVHQLPDLLTKLDRRWIGGRKDNQDIGQLMIWTVALTVVLIVAGALTQFGVRDTIAHSQIKRVSAGLEAEKQELLTLTGQLSDRADIKQYVAEGDVIHLTQLLSQIKADHQLDFVTAVNAKGAILARVPVELGRGEQLFQTAYTGRQVAQGKPAAVVSEGRGFPMVVAAGYPLKRDGRVAGGIFAGYSLEDEHTVKFHNRYLRGSGTQVAFYTRRDGMQGSSFNDIKQRELVLAYFSSGSDWVQEGKSNTMVELRGQVYWVDNLVLPGLDSKSVSPGGVLVFVPLLPHWAAELLFVALVVLGMGLGLYWLARHRKGRGKHGRRPRLWELIAGLSLVIVIGLALAVQLYWVDNQRVVISEKPFTIYNSTLSLWPDQDLVSVGATKRVEIRLNAGGEAINVVQVVLNYDPNVMAVKEIWTDNSFVPEEAFLEKYIDNELGEVSIVAGLPAGSYSGSNGVVAGLLLQALAPGQCVLRFGDDTQVLASDGLGTNVLRTVTDGSYRVMEAAPVAGGSNDGNQPLSIFSSSHSNPERWSRDREISMSWPTGWGSGPFIYSLDQNPNGTSANGLVTDSSQVIIQAPGDGVWYFHLAALRFGKIGPTTHYKIKIDTAPPTAPLIRASATQARVGDVVRFEFFGYDAISGIEPGFYVQIDKGPLLPSLPYLYVPFTSRGEHTVLVRVFDNAGNLAETSQTLKITS